MPIVTLLTDFGMRDTYVAEVKAVLLARLPRSRLVDLTHEVPAYAIEAGAFHLLRACAHFPKGTWHLAIVDPGVGSPRRGLYIRTRDYHFVGPDNGLLLWAAQACAAREGKPIQVFEIPAAPLSPTFHGRDWFAPFLARQAVKPRRLVAVADPIGRRFPQAVSQGGRWIGEILLADHFGNLITSIPSAVAPHGAECRVAGVAEKLVDAPNYAAIPAGRAALVAGSHGYWEIACNQGSAADKTRAAPGAEISLFPRPSPAK